MVSMKMMAAQLARLALIVAANQSSRFEERHRRSMSDSARRRRVRTFVTIGRIIHIGGIGSSLVVLTKH